MRRSVQMSLAACAVALASVGITNISAAAKPGPSGPALVAIDDGGKTTVGFKAPMTVGPSDQSNPTTVKFQPGNPEGVPTGMRLVIETISVSGESNDPVTQDQAIGRVLVSWPTPSASGIAVPLDRYFWESCPDNTAPDTCDNPQGHFQYAGTVSVHAYADSGAIVSATAWHPGDGVQHLSVLLFGYLVPLTSQQ